jgi:hypothetical protein
MIDEKLSEAIQNYCKHLEHNYMQTAANSGNNTKRYYPIAGRKYIHIVMEDVNTSYPSRSSHSWIVIGDHGKFKHGDILKSASWKAPAKNFSRGNVLCGGYKQLRWCGI